MLLFECDPSFVKVFDGDPIDFVVYDGYGAKELENVENGVEVKTVVRAVWEAWGWE